MLEKLTGTEQYSEISRRIFAKNAEAKEAYEQLYARVQDIELLWEEVEASQIRHLRPWRGAGPSGEGEGPERQSLQGGRAAEVQIASEGKTAGGERPFLGTGVGIAGNLKEGV